MKNLFSRKNSRKENPTISATRAETISRATYFALAQYEKTFADLAKYDRTEKTGSHVSQ
jgi:hypothetical protein